MFSLSIIVKLFWSIHGVLNLMRFQGLVGDTERCFRCSDHELAGGRGRAKNHEEETVNTNSSLQEYSTL